MIQSFWQIALYKYIATCMIQPTSVSSLGLRFVCGCCSLCLYKIGARSCIHGLKGALADVNGRPQKASPASTSVGHPCEPRGGCGGLSRGF